MVRGNSRKWKPWITTIAVLTTIGGIAWYLHIILPNKQSNSLAPVHDSSKAAVSAIDLSYLSQLPLEFSTYYPVDKFQKALIEQLQDTVPEYKHAAYLSLIESANQGNADAQYELALIYLEGDGLAQNLVMAKKWFEIAYENGHSAALAELKKIMTKQELAEVGELTENTATNKQEKVSARLINPECFYQYLSELSPGYIFECPKIAFQSSVGAHDFIDAVYPENSGRNDSKVYVRMLNESDTNDAEFATYKVTYNGGGTGWFDHLLLISRKKHSDLNRVEAIIEGGDRCNDGKLSDVYVEGEFLHWSSSATTFRLLNPLDDNNWRMISAMKLFSDNVEEPATVFGWKPYEDVDNGAVNCRGKVFKKLNLDTLESHVKGIEVDIDRWMSQNQGNKVPCLRRWFQHSDRERIQYEMDDWKRVRIEKLEQCG